MKKETLDRIFICLLLAGFVVCFFLSFLPLIQVSNPQDLPQEDRAWLEEVAKESLNHENFESAKFHFDTPSNRITIQNGEFIISTPTLLEAIGGFLLIWICLCMFNTLFWAVIFQLVLFLRKKKNKGEE